MRQILLTKAALWKQAGFMLHGLHRLLFITPHYLILRRSWPYWFSLTQASVRDCPHCIRSSPSIVSTFWARKGNGLSSQLQSWFTELKSSYERMVLRQLSVEAQCALPRCSAFVWPWFICSQCWESAARARPVGLFSSHLQPHAGKHLLWPWLPTEHRHSPPAFSFCTASDSSFWNNCSRAVLLVGKTNVNTYLAFPC